jgi:hypothetical protein
LFMPGYNAEYARLSLCSSCVECQADVLLFFSQFPRYGHF